MKDGSESSRFDRFHVNVAADGTGVGEIMQILSGNGVRLLQQAPGGGVLTMQLDCPSEDSGWILTDNGASPHIGSLSGATPGAKVFMQVIGPARWVMRGSRIRPTYPRRSLLAPITEHKVNLRT